ncbi:hypothetical protein [Nonomuraea sp. NPDC049684]|uniref:hypothetical protein n=1 Tax=Nonomuraea sp. NPDC049684 TaxID=3364356 RepID=UPI0037A49057
MPVVSLEKTRIGTAPRALAGFRNLAISIIRLAQTANIGYAAATSSNYSDAFEVIQSDQFG